MLMYRRQWAILNLLAYQKEFVGMSNLTPIRVVPDVFVDVRSLDSHDSFYDSLKWSEPSSAIWTQD